MKGRLHLHLRSRDGATVERRADNAVMRAGADLIARLFAGRGAPITHMVVGTSDAPEAEAFATDALANGDSAGGGALTGGVDVAIPGDAFTIDVDASKRVVWVRLRATLPPAVAIGTIREAGLAARAGTTTTLYNRVTFAPVVKRAGDELTLFWEVSFPYGDVQWLM